MTPRFLPYGWATYWSVEAGEWLIRKSLHVLSDVRIPPLLERKGGGR